MLFANNFLGGHRWTGQRTPQLGTFTGQFTTPVGTPQLWHTRTRPLNAPDQNETIQISSAPPVTHHRSRRRR